MRILILVGWFVPNWLVGWLVWGGLNVNSIFVRKKRFLEIRWMLGCPRTKLNMKDSSIITIKEERNLNGER